MEKPYKVSTITATGRVNTNIDLDILFENLHISRETDHAECDRVIFTEYGNRRSEVVHDGYAKRLAIADRRMKSGKCKRFNNQVTVVYNIATRDFGNVMVNVKVFKNGHIQMTGLKCVEHGIDVIGKLVVIMKGLNKKAVGRLLQEESKMKITDYKIRLINCDFKIGFEVRRDVLHSIVNKRYNIACKYEPCIYPGCKIQYCYNSSKRVQDGVCTCIGKCNGKGSGKGDGECKKVTIAVFQSGCIIITGGQSYEQIDSAYKFVNGCITSNYDEVRRKPIMLLAD
jgi:TATA-box binding protein (TBP) (component of TFIID and TFIIIB)